MSDLSPECTPKADVRRQGGRPDQGRPDEDHDGHQSRQQVPDRRRARGGGREISEGIRVAVRAGEATQGALPRREEGARSRRRRASVRSEENRSDVLPAQRVLTSHVLLPLGLVSALDGKAK